MLRNKFATFMVSEDVYSIEIVFRDAEVGSEADVCTCVHKLW